MRRKKNNTLKNRGGYMRQKVYCTRSIWGYDRLAFLPHNDRTILRCAIPVLRLNYMVR